MAYNIRNSYTPVSTTEQRRFKTYILPPILIKLNIAE